MQVVDDIGMGVRPVAVGAQMRVIGRQVGMVVRRGLNLDRKSVV